MFSLKKNKKQNKTKKAKTNKLEKNNKKQNLKYDDKIIVIKFLEMLNTIKLYHWKTFSFAQHKATDELYAKLNENIDNFINEKEIWITANFINTIIAPTIAIPSALPISLETSLTAEATPCFSAGSELVIAVVAGVAEGQSEDDRRERE